MGIKSKLEAIHPGFKVIIDLKNTKLVDHSVMESLHNFEHDNTVEGGIESIVGHEDHKPLSSHALAGRFK